jgi:lipopolysaccharide transport system ATP-binding protein
VSHSMPDIEQFCERAILLDNGTPRFIGPAAEAAKHYYLLHQPPRPQLVDDERDGGAELALDGAAMDRPPEDAFLDISGRAQVSDGSARCTGVALLDAKGAPRSSFQQGDRAIFYFEFDVAGDIGVPVCGMTISNDRGVIVHGKNNLQFADDAPTTNGRTRRVSCYQEVRLDLAAGEYTFEIGLAATSRAHWDNRERSPYEAELGYVSRLCHIANAGSFSIRMGVRNGVTFLTHHGVADLPGAIRVQIGQ